jgi:hypothetical protein
MGRLVTSKPEDCSSSSISPNVIDPSNAVGDPKLREILKRISDGSFKESDFMDRLAEQGIKDVIIENIAPVFTDGVVGKVQYTIVILGDRKLDEVIEGLRKALAVCFKIEIRLLKIELSAATSSKKRAGSANYLGTTTLLPAGEGSSSFSFSPIWFLSLLMVFPLWRNNY